MDPQMTLTADTTVLLVALVVGFMISAATILTAALMMRLLALILNLFGVDTEG